MSCLWPAAAVGRSLGDKEVHVWCAHLEPPAGQLTSLQQILAEEEAQRAARFRFWRHRRRYIAGRGILRVLMGSYLNMAPEDVKFSYSEYDKPFLPDHNIQFNLAHSEAYALYAFCLTADIGIDLEKIRILKDADNIAARFFAPTEYARFRTVPQEDKYEAFFRCWTRKEAFIKAVGEGLSYPLADFDVAFEPEKAQINSIRGSKAAAQRWSLFPLSALPEYTAALVVEGREWQIFTHHLQHFP